MPFGEGCGIKDSYEKKQVLTTYPERMCQASP